VDVELIIDGSPVSAPDGSSLLTAARRAGRDVPGLCHHDAVPANASCRLCLVEIRRPGRDWAQLTTSCDYPVSAGLTVVTDSPRIRELRRMNLQLLLRRAPEAPVLVELAGQYGAGERLFAPVEGAPLPDCILCELCVRGCTAAGYDALAVSGRGSGKYVGPAYGHAAAEDCVGCGTCWELCPTDCIEMVDTATIRTIWGRTFDLLTCTRCGKPITTQEHRETIEPGIGVKEGEGDLCDACKRRLSCERLASPTG
jgi:NADH dehydrogenase/NADH:ubiquinone oxidoreductase subunit G